MTRANASGVSPVRRLSALLRDWFGRGLRAVAEAARRLGAAVRSGLRRICRRWVDDSMFRRTLASAITAVTTTAIPNPAVSAAVSAYLVDRPRRPITSRYLDDEDDDQLEPDWPAPTRRLWESLD